MGSGSKQNTARISVRPTVIPLDRELPD